MKTIRQKVSLAGQHETISLSDLRSRPGDVFQAVELGQTFDVTKNNRVIATISPPEINAIELGKAIRQMQHTMTAPD